MHQASRRTVLSRIATVGLGSLAGIGSGKLTGGPGSDESRVRARVAAEMSNPERCRLPRSTVDAVGVEPGHQVRLVYDGAPALFTVAVSDDKFAYLSAGGRDRLNAKGGSVRADLDPTVVDSTLDASTAPDEGGFFERLIDPGTASLASLAPHGGYIEWGTDRQAQRLSEQLGAVGWYSAGYWPGGGAYRRWHVTSTEIHPASFPALNAISDRGFAHAVSFHGWSASHVAVGGAAPEHRREAVRDAIADVVDCDVRLATDDTRDGDSPDNIVNWMAESGSDGVQIEQPYSVRADHATDVADAVADVAAEW